jgi:hypothetical protein
MNQIKVPNPRKQEEKEEKAITQQAFTGTTKEDDMRYLQIRREY